MPPRVASISELLNSLDAAEYFFASSAIFVAVTALLFFGLGVWLGGLLWGRFKRRFRDAESAIESYKGEVALLKHRIAEQTTRHAPGAGPSPLRAIAFRAAAPKSLTPSPSTEPPATPSVPSTPSPSQPLTPLSVPSSSPTKPRSKRSSSSAPIQPLFSPLDVFMVPRSHAFSVWTEASWSPPVVKPAPAPVGRGFAIWTLSDFEPVSRCLFLPSQAHSVWTEPGWSPLRHTGPPNRSARSFTLWTESKPEEPIPLPASRAFTLWTEPSWSPPRHLGPPPRSARAFTIWTAPDWSPHAHLPSSRAFTLWTDSAWSPARVKAQSLPPSSAWSLWTCSSFEPPSRNVFPPSRAYSLWTEEGWMPDPINVRQTFPSKAFSLWTEVSVSPVPSPGAASPKSDALVPQPTVPPVDTPPVSASAPKKLPAFMSRAYSAAKQALGLGGNTSVAPMPVPAISTKPSPVASEPAPPADIAASTTDTTPPSGNSAPSSKAFTLWTNGPALDSAGKSSAHPSPASIVPPVPAVPLAGATETDSPSINPPPSQAVLHLEPLVVPGGTSKS